MPLDCEAPAGRGCGAAAAAAAAPAADEAAYQQQEADALGQIERLQADNSAGVLVQELLAAEEQGGQVANLEAAAASLAAATAAV
jgi:hypothetical protein